MRIDGPQITSSLTLNGTTITDLNMFATTASLNTLSGSYATTGSNLFKGTQTISGSLIPAVDNTYDLGSLTHQFRDLYLSSASLYIDGTKVLSSTTQELQITTDAGQSFKILEAGSDTITLQSGDGNITLASSGGGDVIMDPTNGIIALKGTTTVYAGNKIVASDGNNIHFGDGIVISGSILSTGTALVSGSSQITFGGLTGVPSGIVSGSSQVSAFGFANTGSNNFVGTQTITGSLFISQNLVVQGSSSLENITASAVNIGANIVNLNTATPAIRFAGLNVFDSGSIGGSGSFLYDSVQDEFIFVHRGDNVNITSSVALMGAQTYNNVGNEIYPTNNRILKGLGNEHVGDSIMSETGGGIGISGSLSITGSIISTGTSLVSGSSQIDVMSTTNIARLATTGSNVFTGNLSGTTATFSGQLMLNNSVNNNYLAFNHTGTQTWYQRVTTANNSSFIIRNDLGGGLNVLTLAESGTATFSSSVTATNLYLGSLTNEQLMISGTGSRGIGISTTTSGDPFVRLYDNTTIKGDIWWGRSGNYMGVNSVGINTSINPNGGNILLGTSTEYGSGFRLQVNGSAYITGIVYSNAGFYINSGQYIGITEAPYTGMYMTNSSSSDGFGALLVTSRTDVARPIIFGTSNGSVSVERLRITPAGVLSGTTAAFSSNVTVGGHGVWTAGNDGSGSGLDADLLDGRDSGGYMTQIQGGINFLQGSYTGWYKLARSSQAVSGAGLRGAFKVIVAQTGNYLVPSQDEIKGFKDWGTTLSITSIESTKESIFQNYRITYDADYSYLEGYVSYFFGGEQSIVINSYVNGLNGLTWTPYTGTVQASSTSSGALSIGKVNNGLTVPYLRSSGGIQFGSGTSTLNYYEEGTFTPTNVGSNMGGVTPIYGRYVRTGNQVSIQVRWNVSPNGTGQRYIVFNLPFAFASDSNVNYTGAVSNYNSGLSANSSNVGTSVRNSSGSTTQQYVEAVFTSNSDTTFLFSMTYFTF